MPVQSNRSVSELTLLTVSNAATDTDIPANTLSYQLNADQRVRRWIRLDDHVDANGIAGTGGLSLNDGGHRQRFAQSERDQSFSVTVSDLNTAPACQHKLSGRLTN